MPSHRDTWEKTAAKARRKRNRERMAKVRELNKKKRRCRTCGKPVAKSPRTGKPSSQCKRHLEADRARKTPPVYELPWLDHDARDQLAADQLAAKFPGGRFDFRREYPLKWLDE